MFLKKLRINKVQCLNSYPKFIPRKVSSKLVVDEDFVMKRLSKCFICQSYKVCFVPGKANSIVQFIRGDNISTVACTTSALQESVQPLSQMSTWNNIYISQEHKRCLAVFPCQVSHMVLWIWIPLSPPHDLCWPLSQQLIQGSLRLQTVQMIRPLGGNHCIRQLILGKYEVEANTLLNWFVASSQKIYVAYKRKHLSQSNTSEQKLFILLYFIILYDFVYIKCVFHVKIPNAEFYSTRTSFFIPN